MDVASSSAPHATVRTANYGAPKSATMKGNFPAVGSSLGPYFSVGRLGFGTFCSIHKCINMDYNHRRPINGRIVRGVDEERESRNKSLRLVAAKVEIGDFKNSGVLGGEASILHFLDDVLPPRTVPTYMGHYVSKNKDSNNKNVASAIVMEYLTGQDMHKIREWATRLPYKSHQEHEEVQQQKQEEDPQFSPLNDDSKINDDNHRDDTSSNPANGSARVSTPRTRRRISLNDAVYLTAHVMLPLLRRMHSVGIIHRDVKPSNVVKRSDCDSNLFCIVDFGLSKSFVVSQNSELADAKQVWKGSSWMGSSPPGSTTHNFKLLSPSNSQNDCNEKSLDNDNDASSTDKPVPNACYRQERSTADFRGTSMYASVRVHQLQEYCPRDDIWSLMYVFCDLASGGLPWMSHAANRDREACKILKERIHGLEAQANGQVMIDTKRLLMGDDYHRALFKKRNGSVDPPLEHERSALIDDDKDPNLPRPLALSEDEHKVGLLTQAFDHLKGLGYSDVPDYDLIQRSLEGFLEKGNGDDSTTHNGEASIPHIDWKHLSESFKKNESEKSIQKTSGNHQKKSSVPTWNFIDDDHDQLDPLIFSEAEESLANASNAEEENGAPLYGEAADLARLPLELRFRIAQMEYNTMNNTTIEPHLAMCDWLNVCFPLLYSSWHSKKYERGGHRSNKDGYRREVFLKLVNKCLDCVEKFLGFRAMSVIYNDDNNKSNGDEASSKSEKERPTKRQRRRVQVSNMHLPMTNGEKSSTIEVPDLLAISKVMFELRMMKKAEEKLSRAPPPRLSFG